MLLRNALRLYLWSITDSKIGVRFNDAPKFGCKGTNNF